MNNEVKFSLRLDSNLLMKFLNYKAIYFIELVSMVVMVLKSIYKDSYPNVCNAQKRPLFRPEANTH